MADEEFEIDLYGDTANEQGDDSHQQGGAHNYDDDNGAAGDGEEHWEDDGHRDEGYEGQQSHPAPVHGMKRKGELDDRPVDPNATSALLLSELNWWNTDDEIRGWAYDAGCEDELKDVTFSEHKVNGKSKGQAYVELTTVQGGTALKHYLDDNTEKSAIPANRKITASYASPQNNPFRTLPKDAPARATRDGPSSRVPSGPGYSGGHSNTGGNYGGGGGNFRGRGNYGGSRGNFNQGGGYNRNFSGGGGMGGGGGFNNNNMGFNGPMGGGGNFNFNRGGMMGGGMRGGPGGMRGGRGGMGGMGGGMGNNMMGGMGPMGGMPMGGMPGNMGPMGMMGPNMGFQGMQPFNPNFFGGGNQGGNDWGGGNPHGAKRPRPE